MTVVWAWERPAERNAVSRLKAASISLSGSAAFLRDGRIHTALRRPGLNLNVLSLGWSLHMSISDTVRGLHTWPHFQSMGTNTVAWMSRAHILIYTSAERELFAERPDRFTTRTRTLYKHSVSVTGPQGKSI